MKKLIAFTLLSLIAFSSFAQTKINPAKIIQGTSGSGSMFLKTDNSGNVSFSNNLNGAVLSGLNNGTLSTDAVNKGQLDLKLNADGTGSTWLSSGAFNGYAGNVDNNSAPFGTRIFGQHSNVGNSIGVDMFQYNPPSSVEQTTDGTTWSTLTYNSSMFTGHLSHAFSGGLTVANGTQKIRFTWDNFGYRIFSTLVATCSMQGNSATYKIQRSADGITWTDIVSNSTTQGGWPGYHIIHQTANTTGTEYRLRVEVTFTWNNANTATYGMMSLIGGYGGYSPLYFTDINRNITFYGKTLNLNSNGTNGITTDGTSFYIKSIGNTYLNTASTAYVQSNGNAVFTGLNANSTSTLAASTINTTAINTVVQDLQGNSSAFRLRTRYYDPTNANTEVYRLGLDYLNGTNWNGYISFYRGSDGSDGSVRLGTRGIDRLFVTESGNVVVGNNSTTSTFEAFRSASTAEIVANYNNSNKVRLQASSNGNGYLGVIAGTGSLSIGVTNYVDNIFMNSSGNIGIGGVTSPTASVDMAGVLRLRNYQEIMGANSNTLFALNAYYSSGWKARATGYGGLIYTSATGDLLFDFFPNTTADASVSSVNNLKLLNNGGANLSKTLTVGAQGGQDVTYITGGSGLGSLIETRYADGTVNSRLQGNSNTILNSTYGNTVIGTLTPPTSDKLQVVGTSFFGGQIKSNVTTGTAPLSIASTTLVSNLNVQYLSGKDSTKYAQRDVVNTFTQSNIFQKPVQVGDAIADGDAMSKYLVDNKVARHSDTMALFANRSAYPLSRYSKLLIFNAKTGTVNFNTSINLDAPSENDMVEYIIQNNVLIANGATFTINAPSGYTFFNTATSTQFVAQCDVASSLADKDQDFSNPASFQIRCTAEKKTQKCQCFVEQR